MLTGKYSATVTCTNEIVNNFVKVDNVIELKSFTSKDQIKSSILNNGPLVVYVEDLLNIQKFRNYNTYTPIAYHAFTIIGWNDDDTWVIKDSWPGATGIYNSLPNPDIISLLQNDKVKLFQVAGIRLNNGDIGLEKPNLVLQNCKDYAT